MRGIIFTVRVATHCCIVHARCASVARLPGEHQRCCSLQTKRVCVQDHTLNSIVQSMIDCCGCRRLTCFLSSGVQTVAPSWESLRSAVPSAAHVDLRRHEGEFKIGTLTTVDPVQIWMKFSCLSMLAFMMIDLCFVAA